MTIIGFVYKHLGALTVSVVSLQIILFVGDMVVYGGRKNYIPYPFEILGPYGLIPLLSKVRSLNPETLGKDLKMLGDFTLILAGVMTFALISFQVLSWFKQGPLTGAVFYLPSLVLAVLWGLRPKERLIT